MPTPSGPERPERPGRHNVVIFELEGADPSQDRIVTAHGQGSTTVVAADPSAIVATAVDEVDGGADQIELCGAMGPLWHARVREAVGYRVPVGAVMYGFEREHSRSFYVAVPDAAAAPPVAVQLVDGEGVELIELDGGFEAADAAQVIDAIGVRAPVGIPSYGYQGAVTPSVRAGPSIPG